MLVQFKFNNYKCFKDETVFNVVASKYYKDKSENLIQTPQYSLLRTAAVYGANASGKTKLFQAFYFMREVVLTSADNQTNTWQKNYSPFLLDNNSENASSTFEVVFLKDGIQYRYGFELNNNHILAEWLFRKKSKEIRILEFDGHDTYYNEHYINTKIFSNLSSAKMFRENSLIISALSMWNDELSKNILDWFKHNSVISTSLNTMTPNLRTALNSPTMKTKIIDFLRSADLGISDVTPNEVPLEEILTSEMREMMPNDAIGKFINLGFNVVHRKYDDQHLPIGYVKFRLESDESYGTYRFFSLAEPIINALETGSVLWIDEIDNGLHYDLVKALVALFQSDETNIHDAQLIINTHNISLIDDAVLFRRDQVFIIEKNRYGEAFLIPVSDFSLRESAKVGKLYREGRFGGVPYLEDLGRNLNK